VMSAFKDAGSFANIPRLNLWYARVA
jgi:hypothetical protein